MLVLVVDRGGAREWTNAIIGKMSSRNMRRQEVGYVLLEECEVVIIPDCNEEDELLSNKNDIGTWHTVDLKSPSCNNNNHCDDAVLDLPKDIVQRELVLRPPNQNNRSSFEAAYAIAPFHGLLLDSSKKRCDASLLAGLAIEIDNQSLFYNNHQHHHNFSRHGGEEQQSLEHYDDIRFLSMESAKIMFLEDISNTANTTCLGSIQYKRIRVAFLITFSFPVIQNDTTYNSIKQSNNSSGKKVLSSAFQLIGSIIRCDWNNLDTKKLQRSTNNDNDGSSNAEIIPFFPQKLTVENLYDRISGASKHFGSDNDDQCNQRQSSCLGILPEEIVRTSIAPYLKARSLHSLRLTNRRMYNRLRSVVPGLKLELFQHQIRSLEWMEIRERRCIIEEDLLRANNDLSLMEKNRLHDGESVCGGDYHRSVTGGATVKLSARPNNTSNQEGRENIYRFDALSGCTVDISQMKSTKAARGGLLCDEPGLGKTVTVLSLILRSLGLSVDATTNNDHSAIDDESIFHSYWESEYVTVHVRRPAILKLITRLIKSDKESGYFIPPISSYDLEDYFDVIKRGDEICFQDIRNKANKGDEYCKSFKVFEADVYRVLQNAMTYNHPSDPVHKAASRMVDSVKSIMMEFKSEQVNTAMKSLSRIRKSDSTSLISILERKKRAELHESLISSSSTLLVVPNPLLKHWEEQILSHIDFQYCSKEQQHIVYYHTKKKNVQASSPALSFDLQQTLAKGPFCFIDDGSKELPPASILSRFTIVLTAYNRFTAEWKLGSLEHEKRALRMGDVYWGDDIDSEASPILKVHWLRLIVDEGHTVSIWLLVLNCGHYSFLLTFVLCFFVANFFV